MGRNFPAFLSGINEDGANIKVNSSFETGGRRNGPKKGKDDAEYVTRHQALHREERAAWRDTQKMQAQADIKLAKIRARSRNGQDRG